MAEVTLNPIKKSKFSLEAESVTPDAFAGKSLDEIKKLPVYYGNKNGKLADFFEVNGKTAKSPDSVKIIIDGDVSGVKRVGERMTAGEIYIKGSAGMYTGRLMTGGKITVEENVGDFSGLQMESGELIVKGSAGNYLGGSYRGDWRGMRGGTIVVEGNVGIECGLFMTGGRIHIKGDCGTLAGIHIKKGLIVVGGVARDRAGAQMTGGNIVLDKTSSLLPGFDYVEDVKNPELDGEEFEGTYRMYSGDHAERNAKGAIYVKK